MKKLLVVLLTMAMIFSMAACGSSDETEETKTLRTQNAVLLGTTDPANNVQTIDSQTMLWQCYEGLIDYAERDGAITGRVADEWTFAEDGSYIDFHINQAVTFHNGQKVTPEDILFTFERYAEGHYYDNELSHFEKVEKLDDENIRIYLKGTTSIPMQPLSMIKIVCKSSVEESGDQAFLTPETSIGTGPYKYAAIDFDGVIRVEAYEDYFRGKANVEAIEWTYLTDSSTALVALQTGDFDFIKLATANVAEMESMEGFYVNHAASTHNSFIGINANNVKEELVRQAILYAIDNETVMNVAYDGYGIVSNGMAEEGMVGGGYSADDYYAYNPEKAVELLLEAGYTQAELDAGVPMGNIVAMSTNYYAKVATLIQEMLGQVGLKFEVTTYEQATVEDMWYFTHSDDLTIVCHGDNLKIDSSVFYDTYILNFMNGAVTQEDWGFTDEMIEIGGEARTILDNDERNALWTDFWKALNDNAIYYSLFHRDNCYGATDELNMVIDVNYYDIYDWSWK